MDELTPPAAAPAPEGTAPLPTSAETGTGAAADDSLAAHEAAHAPDRPEPASEDAGRDDSGRFKPRRRAQSQQADADDVPTINALTARLKAAEDAAGKDITRQEGESERVFTLRRRAELAERHNRPAPEPQRQAPAAQPQRQPQPIPQTFPDYEDYVQIDGLAETTFNQYLDARAEWRYAHLRAKERADEAYESAQRTQAQRAAAHTQRVTAARKTYTDWDTVVTTDLPISQVLHDAVLASESGADIQYYLGQHRDELAALVAESTDYSPSAVQAMRRYLDTLVAPQRSSRAVAAPTRSALALAPTPTPPPPNLVRTGPVTPADEPPGDGDSLAAHEKFYRPKQRA